MPATIPTAAALEQRAHDLRVRKAELARRCGVTREHLTQVLNGKEKGSDTLLLLVERVLSEIEAERAEAEVSE